MSYRVKRHRRPKLKQKQDQQSQKERKLQRQRQRVVLRKKQEQVTMVKRREIQQRQQHLRPKELQNDLQQVLGNQRKNRARARERKDQVEQNQQRKELRKLCVCGNTRTLMAAGASSWTPPRKKWCGWGGTKVFAHVCNARHHLICLAPKNECNYVPWRCALMISSLNVWLRLLSLVE